MKIFFHITAVLMMVCGFSYGKETTGHSGTIQFTENRGQWPAQVNYRADVEGGAVFFENKALVFHMFDPQTASDVHQTHPNKPIPPLKAHAFSMYYSGAQNPDFIEPLEQDVGHKNFFRGKNPEKWFSGVKMFSKLRYHNLYPGVLMEAEGMQNSIKYTYIVAPGVKPDQIQWAYKGLDSIELTEGNLILKTNIGKISDSKPIAWQWIHGKKVYVSCEYIMRNGFISFKTGKTDPTYELVIDPVLVFASYTGSTADNFGMTATYDLQGNLYGGGIAFDIGYPVTFGAYDGTYNGIVLPGRTDVTISKFSNNGSSLIYSTYLGGADGTEIPSSLIVNSSGELCVLGVTGSADFPVTLGAFDTIFSGGPALNLSSNGTNYSNGTDLFICRFSADGSQLEASTYLGGSNNEGVNLGTFINYNYGDFYRGEINLDLQDNIYIGSCTYSTDFPVSPGAFQTQQNGLLDGVIFTMPPTLDQIVFSSFYGGSQNDAVYSLSVFSPSNVIITGGTESTDLTTTPGVVSVSYMGGNSDGFVAVINPQQQQLSASSFIGTGAYDQSFFVQNDATGNVYLLGQTEGPFPVISAVYSNPGSGQFIVKLDSLLQNVLYSTTFGNGDGNPDISPSAFLVDICENVYVSGWGGNILTSQPTNNMPLTANAFQSSTDGFNFYLIVLERDLASLIYATYFGGGTSREHVDGGTSRFDKQGIVYQAVCAGCSNNDDFPTTSGAWSNSNNSTNCNMGVFKFDFQVNIAQAGFSVSSTSGCSPLTVNFTNQSSGFQHYLWDFGNNDTTSQVPDPVRTFTTPGTYIVKLYISGNNSCNAADSSIQIITVHPVPQAGFTTQITPCVNEVVFGNTSVPIAGVNFQWNFGDGNQSGIIQPSHLYDTLGIYDIELVALNNFGCSDTTSQQVNLNNPEAVAIITNDCGNNLVTFQCPSTATVYYWDFGDTQTLSDTSFVQNPSYYYPDTGHYQMQLVITWGTQNQCSDTLIADVHIRPAIQALFSYRLDSCSQAVLFNGYTSNSTIGVSSWLWNFGDGNTGTTDTLTHVFQPGNYLVNLGITASNGCSDTIQQSIIVEGIPDYVITQDTTLCIRPSTLTIAAGGGDFYAWHPSNLFTNPNAAVNQVLFMNDQSVSVLTGFINQQGDTCFTRLFSEIRFSELPDDSIYFTVSEDTVFNGDEVVLEAMPQSGQYVYTWGPAAVTDPDTGYRVTANPTTTTEFTLHVSDNGACLKEFNGKVYVLSASCNTPSIFVPNMFTPNQDGINDSLMVRGNYISEMQFRIFNRWGELVFETSDRKSGWDGTYLQKPADPGVYAWHLTVTCKKGEQNSFKGNVTLAR